MIDIQSIKKYIKRVSNMSLFQCENCGCVENTALSSQCTKWMPEVFDWEGIEDLEGKALCCVCAPKKFSDGNPTKFGKWHNHFPRMFLSKGEWETNKEGNLSHKKTGETDFEKYKL
jgi:hypothetical protein